MCVHVCRLRSKFTSGSEKELGSHDKGIKSVLYNEATSSVITGGWDKRLRVWDPRADSPLEGSFDTPGKVYAMDQAPPYRLVVGMSGRWVNVYDVRNMSEPEQQRESSLQHQTRCLRVFPDGTGFCIGSIEGRCAVEFFDPSAEVQAKKYAFKCHRSKDASGAQTLYPVNALAFHPKYNNNNIFFFFSSSFSSLQV